MVVEWMVKTWGIELLRSGSGVIDVGGDPGFGAVACLRRGIPAIVVDPTWGVTGKSDAWTTAELYQQHPGGASLSSFNENFDSMFCERNPHVVTNASVIMSLYGDEATAPTIQAAVATGRPCVVIPCNECVRFFPPQNQTYDAYVQACVDQGNQQGGTFELVQLHGAPFSRALVAQPPQPAWADNKSLARGGMLNVPVDVLREMGVLHQVVWQMELAAQRSGATANRSPSRSSPSRAGVVAPTRGAPKRRDRSDDGNDGNGEAIGGRGYT